MSFIDMGDELANAKEAEPAPEGEYDLVLHDVEEFTNEAGNMSLKVLVKFDDNAHAPFTHWVSLPSAEDDAAKIQAKALFIKRFLVAFNVPMEDNGFNPTDIPGCRARLAVKQNQYTNKNGDEAIGNNIVLPRLA